MEAHSDHFLTLHYRRSPAVCSSWVPIILYVFLRGKNKGLLWEFSKHLPSYQPLRVLNANTRWGYFCDHTDSSMGTLESQWVPGVQPGWQPSCGAPRNRAMCVWERRARFSHGCSTGCISDSQWTQVEPTHNHSGKQWLPEEQTTVTSRSNGVGISWSPRVGWRKPIVWTHRDHSHECKRPYTLGLLTAWGERFNMFEPQFPHLQNGSYSVVSCGFWWDEWNHVYERSPMQCLACNRDKSWSRSRNGSSDALCSHTTQGYWPRVLKHASDLLLESVLVWAVITKVP